MYMPTCYRKKIRLYYIRLIAEFWHKNKKYPSASSNDPYEKALSQKLIAMKIAKKGVRGVWSQEFIVFATNLGCPDMFDNKQEKTLEDIKLIASFFHKFKRYPSCGSEDPVEKKLGCKCVSLKESKIGKRGRWSSKYDKLAQELNCNDMFDMLDFKEKALEDIQRIANFFRLNGKYPSQIGTSAEEKRLGRKLANMKTSKNGKGNGAWYPEYEKLAQKLGCLSMFKRIK